jgi:alpha-N-arabinofuranosidase
MNLIKCLTRAFSPSRSVLLLALAASSAAAQTNSPVPVLKVNAADITAHVSPTLYGLMTEEINFAYEGGLYGELIRNRSFKASTNDASFWTPVGNGVISLDPGAPLNSSLDVSLKLNAASATPATPAGISNPGYWGIPVRPKTTYHASFYAKAANGFNGPLTVAITSNDGKTTFASGKVTGVGDDWKKFEVTLKTSRVKSSKDNQFTITATTPGTVWFSQVSLFPPTYKDSANGNRPDIMQLLADMQPKFLRFPGGNYLEGNEIETRFNWKNTIGDVAQRPGHKDDAWGYWSTDGMGLLEFLDWCEDLNMQPVLAVYAGYSLHQRHVEPGADLQPYVQDALDEIEYVTGDTSTKWGAERAKDGHPTPFKLTYVEVGNEDWFDRSGTYDARFAQIYDAIKAKYPDLQIISTAKVKSRTPDLLDNHLYPESEQAMEARAHEYDPENFQRTGPKIFVGEWATRAGTPTPNMGGALGDAAWMTGMERNSDVILISCYAPLFVNVSDLGRNGSMQWRSDLIGYDALTSYGSPSYYAQQMFSANHGDEVLATDSENIPEETWQPPTPRRRPNGAAAPPPAPRQIKKVFFDATRDSKSGIIYLKVVNGLGSPQPIHVQISGVSGIAAKASALVMQASSPDDTNSLQDPKKIVPVKQTVKALSADFIRTFPPYSITVLELKAK